MYGVQIGHNSNLASYAAVHLFLNAQKYVLMTLLHLTMLTLPKQCNWIFRWADSIYEKGTNS